MKFAELDDAGAHVMKVSRREVYRRGAQMQQDKSKALQLRKTGQVS
jgi:hypothetical protein